MKPFRGVGWACALVVAAAGAGPLWASGDVAGQPCCGPAAPSCYPPPACPVQRCYSVPVTCCAPACRPCGPVRRLVHRIFHPFQHCCKPCCPCPPAPVVVPAPPAPVVIPGPPVPLAPPPSGPPAAGEPGVGLPPVPAPVPPVTGSSYRPERPVAPVAPEVLTPQAPPPPVRLDHFTSFSR
jgi:hypothetical protein